MTMGNQRPVNRKTKKPKPGSTHKPSSVSERPDSLSLNSQPSTSVQADYLPARMVNEFVYCPRLFHYEHVEGIFVHNRETVEGSIGHRRVDAKEDPLPPPEELIDAERPVKSRSVMLSSEFHGVIAKMDLIEI